MTLSAEWELVCIKEVCDAVVDCVNKTAPTVEYETPYKMIRTSNVKSGWINLDSVKFVEADVFAKWNRRTTPKVGDVILTREAPLGEVGMIRTHDRVFLGQRLMLYRANPNRLDNRFLLAAFQSDFLQGQIKSLGSGATVEHMRVPDAEKLMLRAPTIAVQCRIGDILSAYDDLIENNTRRIKILEQMAQMFYREWFVNFRFPGHEKVKMVESDLGLIPEGWRVERMDTVSEVIDCLHSKKPDHEANGTGLMLQLVNIGDNGKLDLAQKYLINPDVYKLWTSRIEASAGDCVVTNVGRIAAVAQIPDGVKAALGRNMTAIRPKTISPTFLIEYLLSPTMAREVTKKKDAGAIMDSLNVKGIIRLSVPVPPKPLMLHYERTSRPIRRQVELLMQKNLNLRTTRDLLLPKLVSGEISVEALEEKTLAETV